MITFKIKYRQKYMLFSPSLNILFSLCAVFSDRIESIKQPLSHIINKELKKFSLLF